MLPNSGAGAEQRAAVVLLQRVLVLAVGQETSPDQLADKRSQSNYVERESLLTLSLTLPEAQLLALASEKGRIAVALRNPDDQRTADRVPDISSSSLLDSERRSDISKGRRVPSGPTRLSEGP